MTVQKETIQVFLKVENDLEVKHSAGGIDCSTLVDLARQTHGLQWMRDGFKYYLLLWPHKTSDIVNKKQVQENYTAYNFF